MSTNERAILLHQRIVAARRARGSAERELALLLAEMGEARHHRSLGFISLAEYAAEHLDLSARQTRDLARLGRRLAELPTLDNALSVGALDWTKARELARVATSETDAAWVARARQVSARTLEREVAEARYGDGPPDDEPAVGPPRRRLVFDLEAADAMVVLDGVAAIRGRTGLSREEVEDGALLAEIVRRGLAAMGDSEAPTEEVWRTVIDVCPDCQRARVRGADISDTLVEQAACDHERVELRPGPEQGQVRRAIPAATRRTVIRRYHGRCAAPGCGNRLWLHLHHVRSRSFGGDHSVGNLVPLCGAHHRAVHSGLVGLEVREGRVVVHRRTGREVGDSLSVDAEPVSISIGATTALESRSPVPTTALGPGGPGG